ncbi:MAG: hypothetical protein VX043_03840 [Candidatus Thermoplasmatota archaeon]|nr:hypothetical protein [Candidatus Thermoplasmatota archaeon]MEC7255704.1 hypothetical protein [Candidatus Thermoplasmatota archaeon]MEC8242539.1 hypothetical protein [Candidatus Thermoplasmatota archaeon]MEC8249632.1 hypothetical protein [Candidatus Thermoplasmatota archaeon]MEC8257832.1 hypothetical protein [Candidatus Thermoplasmatota archaeon]
MTLTKKQAAQLCIDALNSEEKLKRKVILVGVNIVIISGVITFLTSWYFGLACLLICGLLGQFAHERMDNSIQARKILAMKSLKWEQTELENPDLLGKLTKIIG